MKPIVAGRVQRPANGGWGEQARLSSWRIGLSILASMLIGVLVWHNRGWLGAALSLAGTAQPDLLVAALLLILLSYGLSSRVFGVALHSLHYRIGAVRLWAMALTAILISQSVPAGGIGSYAFLVGSFRRRGVATGHAALLAALEALSYAAAMLLIGAFSVAYMLAGAAGGASLGVASAAAVLGVAAIGMLAWILRQPPRSLRRSMLRLSALLPERHRRNATRRLHHTAAELLRARELLAARPRMVALLVGIQLLALCGHALALLLLLWALGAPSTFGVALAAFGVALVSSTFNVLPGGGGTVETAIVAALLRLGAGDAAVPAAILFRLLNFWALLPIAGVGYFWVMRQPRIEN